jgi:peroxiredoxin
MRTATTPLTFACVLLSLAIAMPDARAQHDVHAALLAPAARKPAPAFHLMDESGKSKQVSDYRGKVVLLNFWATDCGGCKLEIPSFIELQQSYKDKGFTAVGVSADISYENLKNADEAWSKVKPFVLENHLNYPMLMGDDPILKSYDVEAFPATYLIDKSGRVAATYVGVVNKNDVESNIKKLLTEQ